MKKQNLIFAVALTATFAFAAIAQAGFDPILDADLLEGANEWVTSDGSAVNLALDPILDADIIDPELDRSESVSRSVKVAFDALLDADFIGSCADTRYAEWTTDLAVN